MKTHLSGPEHQSMSQCGGWARELSQDVRYVDCIRCLRARARDPHFNATLQAEAATKAEHLTATRTAESAFVRRGWMGVSEEERGLLPDLGTAARRRIELRRIEFLTRHR